MKRTYKEEPNALRDGMAKGVDTGNVMSLLLGAAGLVMLSGAVTGKLHLNRYNDKDSEKERERGRYMRARRWAK